MTEPTTPPSAPQRPTEHVHHGDTRIDEYAWLSDRDDPETLAYLRAENAWTEASLAHLDDLRETLFTEIRTRTQETDLSLPARHHGWWYYSRTVAGAQYAIECRVPAVPGDTTPPSTDDGTPLPGEEVLLDGNEVAEGHDFFRLGTFDISPDGRFLAYSTDFSGDERYTIRIKDLVTGEVLDDEISGDVGSGSAWSADASVLFYLRVDSAWRPFQIWRHVVGTPAADDVLVLSEPDERFFAMVGLTRSERFVMIGLTSKVSGEWYAIPSDAPLTAPRTIAPREDNVKYLASHHGDRFLILHNRDAEDWALASTPVDAPGEWTTLVEHKLGTRLSHVYEFADHLVIALRRDGLTGLRVTDPDGTTRYDIEFPEPLYTVRAGTNDDFDTGVFRLTYTSLVTPDSVYDCDIATGALTLRKQRPVLPDPSGRAFDPTDYAQHRVWAVADDGTRVPISILARRDHTGPAPLLLYGYGSYESSADPSFSIARLSLVDRGVVYAIAHVRGGGEMGRHWYEQGKFLAKKNTFTDYIACARHLAATGWTTPEKTIAYGGSAGGLLVGAAVTMAPDAFGGAIAAVPFVDALTTILDPTVPLTVTEWEEWGNPLRDPEYYHYMKSYAPYENVGDGLYPALLVMAGLNDSRVSYAEPAKWVARIRSRSPRTPVLLKTEMGAGHGGPSGRYDSWRQEALRNAWVLDRVGLAGE